MNQTKLKRYRSILRRQLRVLLGHNDETVGSMEDDTATHADPNDRAALESDRNFDLRLRDRDRKLILKIKEALVRIEEGTFGVCEDCGGTIPLLRLRALPWARHCLGCKAKDERPRDVRS